MGAGHDSAKIVPKILRVDKIAPAHKKLSVQRFLNIGPLQHFQYSLNMAPYDFFMSED